MVMTAGVRRASLKSFDDSDTGDVKDQVDFSIFPSDLAADDKMSSDREETQYSDGRSFNKTIQAKLTNFDGVRVNTKGLN